MATAVMTNFYSINEVEAQQMANAPKTRITPPSYVNKFHLSIKEREERALEALGKWR